MRHKHSISTRRTGRVRSSCAYAYAYVVGVLTCFSADCAFAYWCAYALVKTSLKGCDSHAAMLCKRRHLVISRIKAHMLKRVTGNSAACRRKTTKNMYSFEYIFSYIVFASLKVYLQWQRCPLYEGCTDDEWRLMTDT